MGAIGSLQEALVASAGGEGGLVFVEGEREETFVSYRELYGEALATLGSLTAAGCVPGEEILLQVEDSRTFVTLFWAALLARLVPVPLTVGEQAEHRQKVWNVARRLARPWLVGEAAALSRLLGAGELPAEAQPLAGRVLAWEELPRRAGSGRVTPAAGGDLAYVQFSSGSTGAPKGVELTHGNLLANIGDMIRALPVIPRDRFLSWMPLTHDMGLIAAHLTAVVAGTTQVLMPPRLFVRRPVLWLAKANEHRASILFSPGFGLRHFLSSFKPAAAGGWDLSPVRITNGAEPVSAALCQRFEETLAPWGLRPGSVFPSYGLAEASVCVAVHAAWRPRGIHRLDRRAVRVGDRAIPAADHVPAVELVEVGAPLTHCRLRICDAHDQSLPEGVIGHIQIAGPNVTGGYYRDPEATRDVATADGWLRTGDLGFLSDGRLVVAGRAKDLLIAGGVNYYPHDLERLAEEVPGVEPGRAVACAVPGEDGGEVPALFVQWKTGPEEFFPLAERIADHLLERAGLRVERVLPVRRIPRTTSGKAQRHRLAEAYAAGELAAAERALAACAAAAAPRLAPGAGVGAIAALVRAQAERLLGRPVGADRPLAEQGLDSQKAVALAASLGRATALAVPVSLAFDHPTVREIALFLAAELGAAAGTAPLGAAPQAMRAAEREEEPIAILGFGCRFPGGADGPEGLWRVLAQGVDAVGEIPKERWDAAAYYDPDPDAAGRMTLRHGGFLGDVDRFDHRFFAVSAEEAEALDPQQRLLLEVSFEALEHAGQDTGRLKGSRTGVFVGLCGCDYAGRHLRSGDPARIGPYSLTGAALSTAAGRLSYSYGFSGPSLVVDTACSSSLVAVHLAAQSLRTGESTLALAGGVNLILDPEVHIAFSRLRAMAPDGRCKAFDAAADGYGRSEGCGVVVLKTLAAAEADGDRVLAVLRGTAVNQDGASNGLTAPNGEAQRRVLESALARAGVDPEEVSYVEAHGTGTPLGDPLEMRAIAAAYRRDGARGRETSAPLLVGSVKTNLGHTEAAAGIAGLLKVVLALDREAVPPHLHFTRPSLHIPWDDLAVRVAVGATPWPRGGRRRLAGVSSFGISGTNAHAVVEEAPARPAAGGEGRRRRVHLLPVSAATREALAARLAALGPLLGEGAIDLVDVAATAALRRPHLSCRSALVGASREALSLALERAAGAAPTPSEAGLAGGAVFVFPGQGSQWPGMARELLVAEPIFRRSMEECEAAFAEHVDWLLLRELTGEGCAEFLAAIDRVQPALFAVQVSLAALWSSWGVRPLAAVGHSMGEVAAAHVAGALSLADASRVICRRSRLLRRLSGRGAMAAVELSFEEAKEAIRGWRDRLAVAAANGPRATVLAGDPEALAEVEEDLAARGVFCRRVQVDVASHSPQVDLLAADLARELAALEPRPVKLPLLSTVTGRASPGDDLDAAYWMANLRRPVRFAGAIAALLQDEHCFFVEVSPHPVLLSSLEHCIEHAGRRGRAHAVSSLRRGEPEEEAMLGSLAELYVHGFPVAWDQLYDAPSRPVDLPPYPWQRERFWLAAPRGRHGRAAAGGDPLLGHRLELAGEGGGTWESEVGPELVPYLADHRVEEAIVFPAAAWIAMVAAALRDLHGTSLAPWEMSEIELVAPLTLVPGGRQRVQLKVEAGAGAAFEGWSAADGEDAAGWTLHARGRWRASGWVGGPGPSGSPAPRGRRVSAEQHYGELARRGLRYGPRFQAVREIWVEEGRAVARIALPPSLQTSGDELHPVLLDACLQTFAGAAGGAGLPVAVGRLALLGRPGAELWAEAAWRTEREGTGLVGDLRVTGAAGEPVLAASGLRFRPLSGDAGQGRLYELEWVAADVAPAPERPLAVLIGRGALSRETAGRAAARGGRALAGPVQIDPESPDAVGWLLAELAEAARAGGPAGLLDLRALDQPDEADPERVTADLLHFASLVRGLATAELDPAFRLVLVTRGAVAAGGGPVLPGQAALLGLGRVVAAEHPELHLALVDLSPQPEMAEIAALLSAPLAAAGARMGEVVLRGDAVLVPRLVPAWRAVRDLPPARREPARGRPFAAALARAGDPESLGFRPAVRRSPGRGEVEVRVAATGLNFLNVLSALGAYPGAPGGFRSLGIECAGEVARVGPEVARLAPGDPVLGLADHCLASHALTRQELLVRRPEGMPPAVAAGLPVAFLTASYALETVARLVPGESVLIHSAAGGVGLAAVQLALRAGTRVFATAGSGEKRALLAGLGVEWAMDSRTLDFADRALEATGGRGVDVVLNSLAGEAMERSLALLAPFGRFLELGKRDLHSGARIELRLLRRGASYTAIDLDRLATERPEQVGELLAQLAGRFARGELAPLPTREIPLAQAAEAFQVMAEGRHMGKLVLVEAAPETGPAGGAEILLDLSAEPGIDPDGTYLVTGGYGALGLLCAEWLLERGAGAVALLGRREPPAAAAERIAALRRSAPGEPRIAVLQADVADEAALAGALEEIARTLPPLRGVLHAAGVLEDGPVASCDEAAWRRVLAPKVAGAWNLDRLTAGRDLELFVLFSSAAGLLGSPGQASYAAANAYLAGLAHRRRCAGRRALAIDWGPVAGIGLAAARAERGERLAREGVASLAPEEIPRLLEAALGRGAAEVAAFVPSGALDTHPLFGGCAEPAGGSPVAARLRSLPSSTERLAALESHLVEEVAAALRCPASSIAADTPWKSLGVDSLLAIRLARRLGESLGMVLPVTSFWTHTTVARYRDFLAARLGLGEGPPPEPAAAVRRETPEALPAEEIAALSEEAAERLLLRKLGVS
jgi:phthiocerol/phenolphthiocerol synthesis type-I polyketide synthase C